MVGTISRDLAERLIDQLQSRADTQQGIIAPDAPLGIGTEVHIPLGEIGYKTSLTAGSAKHKDPRFVAVGHTELMRVVTNQDAPYHFGQLPDGRYTLVAEPAEGLELSVSGPIPKDLALGRPLVDVAGQTLKHFVQEVDCEPAKVVVGLVGGTMQYNTLPSVDLRY